ncbi:MAG TPA: hypothetical protein VEC57_02295 [Candidatus Limnocylindrales bacterium]|nr:hypothetical protein [Candidatus Limnocylindrales bacterium]
MRTGPAFRAAKARAAASNQQNGTLVAMQALAILALLALASGARADMPIIDVETGVRATERIALGVGALDVQTVEYSPGDPDDRADADVDVDVKADLEPGDDDARKVFNEQHRTAVRQYFKQPADGCTAGMEKKDDGFCGPRQSERVWSIGKPLAESVLLDPVPAALIGELPNAAPGQAYGLINGDIVLYDLKSRVVIDAVTWDS